MDEIKMPLINKQGKCATKYKFHLITYINNYKHIRFYLDFICVSKMISYETFPYLKALIPITPMKN